MSDSLSLRGKNDKQMPINCIFFPSWSFGSNVSNFACSAFFLFFYPFSYFQEESPLSVSSPEGTGTWLHYTSGVGTGRRRRRSGEQITSSPVSPKSLAFTSSIFGSWQQVFKLYFIKHFSFLHSEQQTAVFWGHLIPCHLHQRKSFCLKFEFT